MYEPHEMPVFAKAKFAFNLWGISWLHGLLVLMTGMAVYSTTVVAEIITDKSLSYAPAIVGTLALLTFVAVVQFNKPADFLLRRFERSAECVYSPFGSTRRMPPFPVSRETLMRASPR